ncbi:MAG TPA: hypothetical protein VF210_04350 [Pseudomonadales bacterium]
MHTRFRPFRWARGSFALTALLCFVNAFSATDARAGTNIWRASVGPVWFWEVQPWPGQNLAGTWWAKELEPGRTYRMSFRVNSLKGKVVLKLANRADIFISEPGSYSFDFPVTTDGKRQMMFRSASTDVRVSVSEITVSEIPSGGTADPQSRDSTATGNIWLNSFGQSWFYETGASGELLAGSWWESSLTPDNSYTIYFTVKALRGKVGLWVGDLPMIGITEPGDYRFDFPITQGGERRLAFQAVGGDAAVSVAGISVAKQWQAIRHDGAPAGTPKGHYISFAQARNLKTEMLDLVQQPHSASSNYHLSAAQELDAAMRLPAVVGIWMGFKWRDLEVADGKYDWSVLDQNMDVARLYGLKFIVAIHDRSFNGTNILPTYFPSQYVLWSTGGGKSGVVAKRWDPYVYNRLIRLYKAIANRYAGHAGFGGIATSETATGNTGGDYTVDKYRHALTQIATQTQAALTTGKFFFYLNFLGGGNNPDMNLDQRVALVRDLSHGNLVIGAPDITPDVAGMPGSASSYRIHVHKTMPDVEQFCHAQHADHGDGGVNVKNNEHRLSYFATVDRIRSREQQSWFKGTPAVFQFDDLRDPNGNRVDLHPNWVLGKPWRLDELFDFGQRNFACDYMFWHYREHPQTGEFGWEDTRAVILDRRYFYDYN